MREVLVFRRIVAIIILAIAVYAPDSHAQSGADASAPPEKSYAEVYGLTVKDAFGEKGGEKNALLYSFNLYYRPSDKDSESKGLLHFVAFSLKMKGLSPDSLGEMRLVSDSNENFSLEAEDRVVARSTVDFANQRVVFRLREEIKKGYVTKRFFLAGDFPVLKDGALMEVSLELGFLAVKIKDEGDLLEVRSGNSVDPAKHREGNDPPQLSYPYRWKKLDMRDGRNPKFGRSGDIFTFAVRYSDPNSDPPVRVELWIDLDENGSFSPQEKIRMEAAGNVSAPSASQEFVKILQIIPRFQGQIFYRFWASDGKSEAEGPATGLSSFEIPVAVLIGNPMLEPPRIVPGERFRAIYPVRFFYDAVIMQWDSVAENKFGPFELLRVFPKDMRPSQRDPYDEAKLVVELKAPDNLSLGKVNIPPLVFKYKWWVRAGTGEDVRESVSPVADLESVPLRAELTLSPTRVLTTTGDYLEARLTVVKLKDVILLSDPEKELNPGPFAPRGSKPVRVSRRHFGGVEEITYRVALSAFLTGSPGRREYAFSPHIIRYAVAGADAKELLISGPRLTLHSLLDKSELRGAVFALEERELAPGASILSLPGEMHAAWWMAVLFFSASAVMILKRPVVLGWGAATLSKTFLAFEARREWRRAVRRLNRSRDPYEAEHYFSRLEHIFRRHLAYTLGLSAEEASSVLLWDFVRSAGFLAEDVRSRALECLEIMVAMAENRAGEQAQARLLSLQTELLRKLG